MLADYHIHTEYSDDSFEPMERIAEKAVSLGIDEICFTDHVDYGIKLDIDEIICMNEGRLYRERPDANVFYPAYLAKIDALRQRYAGRLSIRAGLEFGVQTHTIAQYLNLQDAYPMDFIIMSCHQVRDKEFWNYDFQRSSTPEECNREYYREIYDCARLYKGYSVLGHLDMIQRYHQERFPFEASREIITEILKLVISDGKGIEVNTSSFQYRLPDLMPERAILELYHQLGGEIITVGSDCHKLEYLGNEIRHIYTVLSDIGYKYFCTFEGMQPIFHAL